MPECPYCGYSSEGVIDFVELDRYDADGNLLTGTPKASNIEMQYYYMECPDCDALLGSAAPFQSNRNAI